METVVQNKVEVKEEVEIDANTNNVQDWIPGFSLCGKMEGETNYNTNNAQFPHTMNFIGIKKEPVEITKPPMPSITIKSELDLEGEGESNTTFQDTSLISTTSRFYHQDFPQPMENVIIKKEHGETVLYPPLFPNTITITSAVVDEESNGNTKFQDTSNRISHQDFTQPMENVRSEEHKDLVGTGTINLPHTHSSTGSRSSTKIKSVECDICGKSFPYNSGLQRHMKSHTGVRPFTCTTCDRSFTFKSDLKRHEKTHNRDALGNNVSCTVCGKSVSDVHCLRRHMKIHTGERAYVCGVCDKTYTCNFDLQIHMRSHTGERPFGCDTCGKAFTSNGNLQDHMKTHNETRGHLLPSCTTCDKSFSSKKSLEVHTSRHHSGERPFGCSLCGECFYSKYTLQRHTERKHQSGERPFACSTCSKSFSTNDYLKIHQRTHSGEKPYSCFTCEQTFVSKTNLNQHIHKSKSACVGKFTS